MPDAYLAAAAGQDNTSLVLAVIALIATPLSGVLVGLISSRASRKNTTTTAAVSQQEADTHEFAELTNAYDKLLARSEAQYARLDLQYQELAGQHISVMEELRLLKDQYGAVIRHVIALEALIPNPPGPPARPF